MTSLPSWLTRSFSIGSDQVPLNEVLRAAVTVPAILAIAYTAGGAYIAIFAGLGALLVVLGERSGTTGQRMFKAGAALVAGTIAMTLGQLTSGDGIMPLVAVVCFSAVAGVLSAYGPALSFAGMQLLVQMSIAGGFTIPIEPVERVLAYVAGGLAALTGAWIISLSERTGRQYPDRLAQVLEAMADWSGQHRDVDAGSETDELTKARWSVDARLALASDLILTARPILPSAKWKLRELRVMRSGISVLVTSMFAAKPLPDQAKALQQDAAAIRTGQADKVRDDLRRYPERAAMPIAVLLVEPLTRRRNWIFVLRLVLCMSIAEIVRQRTPLGHPYWILLTVALVLKPDLASVFARCLQRCGGTAIGMLAAWIATLLAAGYAVIPFIALLSAAIPYSVRRNYAWFSAIITPLVLLLLDFGGPVGIDVMVQRLANTLTGGLIVIVAGYILWPETWRPSARPDLARICNALADLIERRSRARNAAAAVWVADKRLEIAREIAALRTRANQALSEPEPIRSRAQHWQDVTAALDRVLDAIPAADPADAAPACSDTLRHLAARLHAWNRSAIHARLRVIDASNIGASVDVLAEAISRLGPYHR